MQYYRYCIHPSLFRNAKGISSATSRNITCTYSQVRSFSAISLPFGRLSLAKTNSTTFQSPSTVARRFLSTSRRLLPQLSHRNLTKSSVFSRTMTSMHLTDEMYKPQLDDRSYRVIELPNKLQALLIHDPETDKASAALDVAAGSASDPKDMYGLAHAVEHLLFMGTEKVCDSNKNNVIIF